MYLIRPGSHASVRDQFPYVHVHGIYDVEVDTSAHSPAACAERILAVCRDMPSPSAFVRLRSAADDW